MIYVCSVYGAMATAVGMAANSSGRKGKLNIDDKVKSRKYNHSFVKDTVGKGKTCCSS